MTYTRDEKNEKLCFFLLRQSRVVLGVNHESVNSFKTNRKALRSDPAAVAINYLPPCNRKLSPLPQPSHRDGEALCMGICSGQAPMDMSPFCFHRVKVAPSEEYSASSGVLVDLVQSLIAIGSVN